MTAISSHIHNLLFEHDCVVVPGLGAFLVQRVPAAFDSQRHIMLPPRKDVVFNSQIQRTDGLLADFIASEEKVSFDDASARIDSFVSDTLRNVNQGGAVLLPDFGAFHLSGGVVVFEPVSGLNLLADSYGLTSVSAQEISASAPIISVSNFRRVAVSAAAVLAFLLISPRTSDTAYVGADFSDIFGSAPAQKPVESNVVASQPEQFVQEEPSSDYFCLVIASFATQDEANVYLSQMRSKGVSDLSVLDNGGRFRVVSSTRFSSIQEANSANNGVRALPGFEKSWVLHVE